jgi:hypothetical protein
MKYFNLLFFTDSLKRFVESLDYFVIAYDFFYRVVKYEDTWLTLQVCLIGLVLILYYELVLTLLPLVLACLILYNRFHSRTYVPPEVCYTRNMQFLQNLIDFIAIVKKAADTTI